MLSDEEKQTIDYLKARLYGNEGCKFIDVAQSDLRIFLKLVENLQKDIESWKKYCDEQENDITLKNNKICDLEFKIEKQSKEIEKLRKYIEKYKIRIPMPEEYYNRENWGEEITIAQKEYIAVDKIKAKIEEYKKLSNNVTMQPQIYLYIIDVLQSLLEKE